MLFRSKVLDASPANRGGVLQGDVILKINGQDVRNKHVLIEKVQEIPVHEEVELEILREKTAINLRVQVGEMDKKASLGVSSERVNSIAGLNARALDTDLRKKLALPKQSSGIYVDEVVKGSAMEKAGVKSGDILIQLNGRPLQNLSDLNDVEQVEEKLDLSLILIRSGKVIFAEVRHDRG